MLGKLKSQTINAITLQQQGNFQDALVNYELILEALHFYDEIVESINCNFIRSMILNAQSTPEMILYFHGLILFYRRHYSSANDTIETALMLAPDTPLLLTLHARILTCLRDLPGALTAYERAHKLDSTSSSNREALFALKAEQEMPGDDYYFWLQRFHELLQPATYVEIGLGHGRSLALAGPETMAIGIDPFQGAWERLNYVNPHIPATLFPLASDDFFSQHDLRKIISKETFDLAFIDGLHLFEQALKDFINLERYARRNSVILIHDCLPIAPILAERERCTGFWTGDVWRLIPCLKTFRPDLKIMTIPTKPSGLGVVTNLDSKSTVLSDNYDDIVSYYLSLGCPESFEQQRIICNAGAADEEYVRINFCR